MQSHDEVNAGATLKSKRVVAYPTYDEYRAKGWSRQVARQLVRFGKKFKLREDRGDHKHSYRVFRGKHRVEGNIYNRSSAREAARYSRQQLIYGLFSDERAQLLASRRLQNLTRRERRNIRDLFDAGSAEA